MKRLCGFGTLFAWSVLLFIAWSPASAHADAAADMRRLADEFWQGELKANPTLATSIGDRRYDALLDDNSSAGIERNARRLQGVLDRAKAIDPAVLSADDRLTRSSLIVQVESELSRIECHFEEWVIDPLGGPQVWIFNLPDITTIESTKDAANYVARCRAIHGWMERHMDGLERGLNEGKVASHDGIRKTLEELDALAAQPVGDWAVLAPAKAEHAKWSAGDRRRFQRDLEAAVEKSVRPALLRFRTLVSEKLLPAARPQDRAGLAALPGGADCYRAMILAETSLDLEPEEVHKIGLEQVAKFRHDLAELGGRVLGTSDIGEIQKKLRNDPTMHFATADEVEAKARETLARAKAAIPDWFGILPKAQCEVKVMGMHEAPNSTIAYYQPPAADGSRPGYYMINTYLPETRPRYEAEALAFHESIPGHHLQIAIQQELTNLPEFRRHTGVTAYVEGWGLYSERLADDMGLYSTDLDRIGMLSFDAWRACRLVVDTGMHAMGWSRQQAIDYMMQNTLLAENNIVNEVDRYLTWPGQALAYKMGQIEILKLRDEARERLGDRFDIKAFHDAVLRNGAVALPVLREQVEAWIAGLESR